MLSALVLMGLTATNIAGVEAAATGANFLGIGPTNPTINSGQNYNGERATGVNAVAIGVNALATEKDSVAIGSTAKVFNEGGSAIGGVAIGANAQSHNMSNGNHESIIVFGRDKSALTGGIAIGQDTHSRIGNVELGNRDYRGQIGDFDFTTANGKIDGTAIANNGKLANSNVTTGVGSTTVGDNSFNMGNFSSINGSYNVISKAYDKSTASWAGNQIIRGTNALHNAGAAIQGFGSSISGSLNSIEGNEELSANIFSLLGGASDPVSGLMYSGTISNIVGTANRINKSNGALIFGMGNEITNSYITPDNPIIMDSLSTSVPLLGTVSLTPTVANNSVKELAETLRRYSQDNRLGSVAVIGGANKVDYALFSTISGVGNTLTGNGADTNFVLNSGNTKLTNAISGNTFAAFNAIAGYENTGKGVSHSYINGSYNNLENATRNIVVGNNQTLKGIAGTEAEGNIILGFRADKDENAFSTSLKHAVILGDETGATANQVVVLGNNAKASVENGVALGSESVADTDFGVAGYDPAEGKASTNTDKTWKSTLGSVSVGNETNTRQITNLAAGTAPTDAVNVAQLQAVREMIVNPQGEQGNNGAFEFTITADTVATPITVAKESPVVQIKGDTNIHTTSNGGNTLTIGLANDVKVNTVTAKTIQAESYKVGDVTYISEQGLNANEKVIKNVAAGEDSTDAANVGQVRELVNTVSHSIHELKKDSNRADAMGAALAALSPLQYDPLERTQIMAGYGYYGGENALALGVAHYKHESLLFRAGIAMNGGNSKVMANAGVTWKFGDSKKERVLAEEYRQGPISSSYVLQDKLATLEAENIQMKAMHEKLVADYAQLEKDNEEMKAKIEVLMQRMGL